MWLTIGLVVGAALVILALWLSRLRIVLKPYDWLVGAFGLGLLLFTIQNVSASIAEHETNPALNFARIFGIPAAVLLLIFIAIIWYRRRAVNKTSFTKIPDTEKKRQGPQADDSELRIGKS
jgi:ABC-type uncharacterized transport system fused permease/ATPase subunit